MTKSLTMFSQLNKCQTTEIPFQPDSSNEITNVHLLENESCPNSAVVHVLVLLDPLPGRCGHGLSRLVSSNPGQCAGSLISGVKDKSITNGTACISLLKKRFESSCLAPQRKLLF